MARRIHRRLAALAVVLVAAAAVAQQPPPDSATGLRESECFRCHETGGGSFGPPLVAMYVMLPPTNLSLALGEATPYAVEVRNVWTAELSQIHGLLDLAEAPSLGFASDLPPTSQSDRQSLPTAGPDGREVSARLGVPEGATDVRVTVAPADGIVAPDLVLNVWPASFDPAQDPPFTIDARGPGGAEVLHVRGGDAVASLGTGAWTVQAQQPLSDLPAVFAPQDVALRIDTWSNVTGDRLVKTASPDILDGQDKSTPQNTTLTWRLRAERPPGPDERLLLTVNATAFYDHPGTTSGGIDEWVYTQSIPIGVHEDLEAPDVPTVIDPGVRQPDIDEDATAIPWDRIGEIIGYVSSFLYVLSMISGGVFGKRSRRSMNRVFKSAKRRVAFHNFVSYLLTFFALAHTVLFIVEPGFPWTLGIIWGGIALLAMFGLGVTGAIQVPMIRRWSYSTWRWTHLGLAIGALVFTIVHLLLDGANFTEVAEAVGWQDPFQ